MKDFLVLTRDDTFVAINQSFIYPTKTATNFIDEEHRPTLKYNLTLKYYDPSKEHLEDQLPEQPHKNEPKSSEKREYFETENQQPDANDEFMANDEHPKTQICDGAEQPNCGNGNVLFSRRETVEQSIKRRNVLIQKLLDSQIDRPISPKKMDSIRFVDVTPQVRTEMTQDIEEHTSPSRNDRFDNNFTSPDTYCRSPKSVSFNPQPQSEADILTWRTKQQEVFLTGLRKKENEHLKSLGADWLQRQKKEEEKLAAKMKKCKLLTETLEQALESIKVCDLEVASIKEDELFSL